MAIAGDINDLFSGLGQQNLSNDELQRLSQMQIAPQFYGGDYQDASYSGDLTPQLFDTPEAAQYQQIGEDPRIRQVQTDALQKLIDTSSGAADARMSADSFNAQDQAGQLARGREGAIRQEAQRRGQGGGGMDTMMRAQAGQDAANRARQGTQQAVLDAALQKLQANQGAISGAGGIRGQDFQRNAANSDIVNRFNTFNTQARNAARQANVGMQNAASGRNLDARQRLGMANTGTHNASIDRRDKLAGAAHDAQMDRFGMENAINGAGMRGTQQAIAGGAGAATDIMNSAMAGFGGRGGGMGGSGGAEAAAAARGAAPGTYDPPVKDPYNDNEDY